MQIYQPEKVLVNVIQKLATIMKNTFTILLIFLFSFSGFSQCRDINKLETGGTYYLRSGNYIPFEVKYTDKVYYDDIFYPFDIKKIEKYSDIILLKVKDYIVSRANIDFYNRLELHVFRVNYDDSIKVSYENQSLYNLSNYNVTYWIFYTYRNNGYEFAFGLEFDKDGKMISENKFPSSKLNPDFENFIKPCKALHKVKTDDRFFNKKVDYIELAYLDEINSFCWLIQENYDISDEIENIEFEKWYYYSELRFYVNANKNVIEKVGEVNKSIIYSGSELKNVNDIKKLPTQK